ncbi:xanthine dehydrogenase family protein molybdopterin-binding subunit [Pseudochelatococcus sp. B33]
MLESERASFIGQRYQRVEDPNLVRGMGRFVDDLHMHDLMEAAFFRSPVAHGLIRSIDVSVARALPGVHAVYTLADLRKVLKADRLPLQFPSDVLPQDISPFILAGEEVSFVGEAIALVVAENRYIAEDALALIDVDIDILPAVSDCRDALLDASPPAHVSRPGNLLIDFIQSYGDAGSAVATAPRRVSLSLKQHRGGAHPIECRGVVSSFDPADGKLTVWSSTQLAHEARFFIMKMLGMDEDHVRVVTPDVGGGFGAKFILYPEEVAISAASVLLQRPIKWIEDRREHLMASIQERDQYWDIEVGFDDDGKLIGAQGTMICDAGSYTFQGINLPYNSSTNFPGPYVLPNYHLHVSVVETNKVATAPVRGAGYPEGCFAMERVMDAIARELSLDRAEVRRRNLIPADAMPYETPMKVRSKSAVVYDSGDFPGCLALALERADYANFSQRRKEAAREGRLLGFGMATGLKGSGRGPFESAIVRVGRSGLVSIYTGAMAMGQGLKTILAQIAADQIGVRPENIVVTSGDTSTIQLGLGGFASRQTVTAGNSVHLAACAVRAKALQAAAIMLEVPEENLDIIDGMIGEKGKNRRISLADISDSLAGAPGYKIPVGLAPGLEAAVNFETSALTYGLGAHAVELEVDARTGAVKLLNYVVVNDCGRVINPMTAEGQIHGGVVHGIGNALFEWMGYDDNAQPFTMTFAEYLLPTAPEIPPIDVNLVEYPSPKNPLGVKGIGESGTVPAAPAIISGIEDALRDYGVTISETPINPARLFQLINSARRVASASEGDVHGALNLSAVE